MFYRLSNQCGDTFSEVFDGLYVVVQDYWKQFDTVISTLGNQCHLGDLGPISPFVPAGQQEDSLDVIKFELSIISEQCNHMLVFIDFQ